MSCAKTAEAIEDAILVVDSGGPKEAYLGGGREARWCNLANMTEPCMVAMRPYVKLP